MKILRLIFFFFFISCDIIKYKVGKFARPYLLEGFKNIRIRGG